MFLFFYLFLLVQCSKNLSELKTIQRQQIPICLGLIKILDRDMNFVVLWKKLSYTEAKQWLPKDTLSLSIFCYHKLNHTRRFCFINHFVMYISWNKSYFITYLAYNKLCTLNLSVCTAADEKMVQTNHTPPEKKKTAKT